MGAIATDLAEMPPRRRRSKYDFLIEHIDGKVVVLPRGEIEGFDERTSMSVIRAALGKWARSRGVELELRYLWVDYRTEEPSRFRIDGKQVPWGLYVRVWSKAGTGPSAELLRLIAAEGES